MSLLDPLMDQVEARFWEEWSLGCCMVIVIVAWLVRFFGAEADASEVSRGWPRRLG